MTWVYLPGCCTGLVSVSEGVFGDCSGVRPRAVGGTVAGWEEPGWSLVSWPKGPGWCLLPCSLCFSPSLPSPLQAGALRTQGIEAPEASGRLGLELGGGLAQSYRFGGLAVPICGRCSACPSLSGSFSLVSLPLSSSSFTFYLCFSISFHPSLSLPMSFLCTRTHTRTHSLSPLCR